jgi:hypothetical protein
VNRSEALRGGAEARRVAVGASAVGFVTSTHRLEDGTEF